jgi:hypothetical protein
LGIHRPNRSLTAMLIDARHELVASDRLAELDRFLAIRRRLCSVIARIHQQCPRRPFAIHGSC